MIGFSTSQVKDLTGLTTRQLNYFDQTGLLKPSVREARGKGSNRLYSFRDLVALRLIAKFRGYGISLQAIRHAVEYIHRVEGKDLASAVLAVNGDDIVLVTRDQTVVSLVKNPDQLYLLIDVGGIAKAVEEALRRVG